MGMDRQTRKAWVARGFQDPVKAYRAHATGAGQRGIAFRLTFAQWWKLWGPHYEQRGTKVGQMCMCRTGDQGAYEVGNVRIDTVAANAAERSFVHRSRNLAAGRLPLAVQRVRAVRSQCDDWMVSRRWVFKEYQEDEDGNVL